MTDAARIAEIQETHARHVGLTDVERYCDGCALLAHIVALTAEVERAESLADALVADANVSRQIIARREEEIAAVREATLSLTLKQYGPDGPSVLCNAADFDAVNEHEVRDVMIRVLRALEEPEAKNYRGRIRADKAKMVSLRRDWPEIVEP